MAITVQLHSNRLYLRLDNLPMGNSFGLSEARDLTRVIEQHRGSSEVSGVVFSSVSPRIFCSGGNLKDYAKQTTKDQGLSVNKEVTQALDLFYKWELPKVAWVEGDCFGGGLELLSCFDKVVASPQAFLGFWQRRIALSFGWGGFQRWCERVSPAVIKRLYLEASNFTSYQAHRFGLVDEIQLSSSGLQAAEVWLDKMSGLPQEPLAVHRQLGEQPEQQLFKDLWFNETHQKILQKFKAKS